jgi:hypothetical protein
MCTAQLADGGLQRVVTGAHRRTRQNPGSVARNPAAWVSPLRSVIALLVALELVGRAGLLVCLVSVLLGDIGQQ